jgi:hypothetical protein
VAAKSVILRSFTHYHPLELKDPHKLYEYLDSNNNIKLQEKVFADLMLYFGRRGRENIHDLKITGFKFFSVLCRVVLVRLIIVPGLMS